MVFNEIKEKQEYLTFNLIQDSLGIKDKTIFKNYLSEIFKDLAGYAEDEDKQDKKIINRITFYDIINLPIIISKKMFKSFYYYSDEGLCEEEFVDNFYKLYTGSFEEIIELIFNFLDFDRDGIIEKDDVKLIMNYLPINIEDELGMNIIKDEEYRKELTNKYLEAQMKNLNLIDNILNEIFNKYENIMDLKTFIEITTKINSEIFLQILCFFYDQMPFNISCVEGFKTKDNKIQEKENNIKIIEKEEKNKKYEIIYFKNFKINTLLSPIEIFFKKYKIDINKFLVGNSGKNNSKISIINDKDKKISSGKLKIQENKLNKKMNKLTLKNDNDNIRNNKKAKTTNKKKDFWDLIKEDNQFEDDNLKDLYPPKNSKDKNNNKDKSNSGENNNRQNCIENNKNKNNDNFNTIKYEDFVYKVTESGNFRKIYLVVINKDIFYFKSETKKEFLGMHHLSGCFINEGKEIEDFKGKKYYSFEIYSKHNNKCRKFYTENKVDSAIFIGILKKALKYAIFSDNYDIKKFLGKGGFGEVYLGIHKKSRKQVAIKILNKEKIKTLREKESELFEIGILKFCHHPNIVKLLDYFLNNEYVYIITEYIKGGTLYDYEKQVFFTESQAANIMLQIANGIKYLQQFYIVHRDLKPNNIMITQQNDDGIIKIMDFGLSKILSPNESLRDPSGTLNYMAPEVIQRKKYNKEVDIWSMGIILYKLISGYTPFRSKNGKEEEISNSILNEHLIFNDYSWKNKSEMVLKLIESCLEKDKKNRMNIDEFLKHPWFKIIKKK